MDLATHYDNIYQHALLSFAKDEYHIDPHLDDAHDQRFGITLLLRPDEATRKQIQAFLDRIRAFDPDQYFYPDSDLHVTILSIISCYEGFSLDKIQVADYIKVIEESIAGMKPFEIEAAGITISPCCIITRGIPKTGALNAFRDRLRTNFKASGLAQSIDKRYAIQTAHSTLFRFKQAPADKEKFLAVVDAFKAHPFGTFTVDRLELVFNDWYQSARHVKLLHEFELR